MMKEWVYRYLDFLLIEKGLAQQTVEAYRRDIEQFETFLSNHLIFSWSALTLPLIIEYGEQLQEKFQRSSRIRKITALRNFLRFLYQEREIEKDYSQQLKSIKGERKLSSHLTLEEVSTLTEGLGNSPKERRDFVMIQLLLFTGARISEITQLRLQDFNAQEKNLKIVSKGSKHRLLPLPDAMCLLLETYLERWRRELNPKESDGFFLIDRKYFWKRLQQLSEKTLQKSIHPHLFRHTVASQLLREGANIRMVQEFLGHQTIATTQLYTHVDKMAIKRIYDEEGLGDD